MPTRCDPRPAASGRDPRLDLFRGLGMAIILVAHIPSNPLAEAIPARFGFSDATEIFVFCSGIASALAFGRVFDRAGLALGSARILHRMWQIYWAHLGVFLATVGALALADRPGGSVLREGLALGPFLDDPARHVAGLLTFTYVPNYFDILPMYFVILALVPVVMTAARFGGTAAVAALCGALWIAAGLRLLDLPAAGVGGDWSWFFNPFSWQLLFFLGFAFGRGWLSVPPISRRGLCLAGAVLLISAPVSCHAGWECHAGYAQVPLLGEIHRALLPGLDKTHFGPLRLIHFLALAYVALALCGPGGAGARGWPGVRTLSLLGRQTLAVFLAGIWLAQMLGVVLDLVGRTTVTVIGANAAGIALLVLVAAVVDWYKGAPWAAPAQTTAEVEGGRPKGRAAAARPMPAASA